MKKINLEKLNADKFSRAALQNIKGGDYKDTDVTYICPGGDGWQAGFYCLP